MKEIHVLVPLCDGERLHAEVLRALVEQDVLCHVVPVSRPRSDGPKGRISQTECRNVLRELASEPYAVMMDSDVVLSSPTDVSDMIAFLDAHPEYDAVALNTKGRLTSHVLISCVCARARAFRETVFHNEGGRCNCIGFTNAVRTEYLDARTLREVPAERRAAR